MNKLIFENQRRLVIITDPHIAAIEENFVYTEGLEFEAKKNNSQIFLRTCDGQIFYAKCWPPNSTWIDYLNEDAQAYWESLYQYNKFRGTTPIYYIWNDMNEPSVFDSEEMTLPKQVEHQLIDGTKVKHRDVHNMYGALMHRTTYRGLLKRDDGQRRPFVLSRSFFIGSQKYGAFWTGDNLATLQEL